MRTARKLLLFLAQKGRAALVITGVIIDTNADRIVDINGDTLAAMDKD